MLMLADGETYDGIQEAFGCGRGYISRWRDRYLDQGVAGVYARHRGRKPADGSTHSSTRKLARELGVGHMLVQRVWSQAGIRPHRTKSCMVSGDPAFERNAADVIGRYLNPPQHTAGREVRLIERDVTARGAFTSVKALARKLMRHVALYDHRAESIKWRYSQRSNRVRGFVSPVTDN